MIDSIIEIDKKIFIFLNNLGSEKWDFLWLFFSNKIVIFSFMTLLVFFYCYSLSIKKKAIVVLFFIICVSLSDFLHVQLFKNVFMRLRPCFEPDLNNQIRLLVDCGGKYGFISGHASNTAAMVTFLLFAFNKTKVFLKYILMFWVLLVSYSRIYIGKHYLLDVFFGVFFGFFIGFLIYKFYHNYIKE